MAGTYRSGEAALLREMVRKKLKIARKYKDSYMKSLEELIIGKSTFATISRNPVTGRPEHNIYAVMETLYEDYREHPELHINKDFEKVLEQALSNEVGRTYLHNAIELLLYQMRSQKQGTAAFDLDCIKLLQDLRRNIVEHRDELELRNMMEELDNYNATLEEHYKQTIL